MHEEEYKGHQITVDTIKVGRGWTAEYQIDGGELRRIDGRPLAERIVLHEAISEAKWRIDQMAEK